MSTRNGDRSRRAVRSGAVLLYDSAVSGNCYKVRLLLAHLGMPYERREVDVVDRSDRKELLGDLNPALRVPTLVFDDGRSLGESDAILWYLADGTQYVPADPWERAKVLQWMFFEQYSHEPHIAVARFWLHVLGAPPSEEALAEKHAARLPRARRARAPVSTGGSSSSATRYSIADIALYAYTHVADEGGFELERYPAIRAWLERVAAQPGHVTIEAVELSRVPAERDGDPPAHSSSSGNARRIAASSKRLVGPCSATIAARPASASQTGAAIAERPTSRSSTAAAQPCARTSSISSASAAGSVIVRGV